MKLKFTVALLVIANLCSGQAQLQETYASSITADELKEKLYIYASDEFEGRNTGEPGQKKAAAYLKKFYVDHGIASPLGGDDYFQEVPATFLNKRKRRFEHIKGHSNDKGNDAADELANKGATGQTCRNIEEWNNIKHTHTQSRTKRKKQKTKTKKTERNKTGSGM